MTKPRILLVTHFYPAHRGGIELFAGKITKALGERGHRLTWAASDVDAVPEHMDGVRFLPMRANNRLEEKLGIPYPIWSRQALSTLKLEVKEADVVYIHDSLYFGNVVAARAARSSRVPLAVTQHIGFVPYKNSLLRFLLQTANRRLALPILRRAQAVSYVSETTRSYFQGLGLNKGVGEVIPVGVNADVFNSVGDARREPFGFVEDRPLCLFVGRFVEKKGLPTIRHMAESLPEVQWALAGFGPINPEEWGLENVKVFGNLAGITLAPLYRAADLLVLPSVGEGYPAVIQEAMACGTHAMVSTETAQGYAPAAEYLLTADPANPEQWVSRCSSALRDRSALAVRSEILTDFVKNHWSWDSCVDRYENMIQTASAGAIK